MYIHLHVHISCINLYILYTYIVYKYHFYDKNSNEYIIKCGIYEDEMTLMELTLSVVSREEANLICKNWRDNVNNLYGDILNKLIGEK